MTIGYAETVETVPGVWTDNIMERNYYGDLTRRSWSYVSSDKVNDDISVSNELDIIADPFAYKNFHLMRYAVIGEQKWKISNVEVMYPRLKLNFGGVYNDET